MEGEQQLFAAALGVTRPWKVTETKLSLDQRRLDIRIDFERGGRFACPSCGEAVGVYDTSEQTWRHLNFFQFAAYITARVPRLDCPSCGVKTVQVPWAWAGSGFTLMFESLVMWLAKQMPMADVAEMVGEHDTRLWRIVHHYVEKARAQEDFSEVTSVGVDETASRRGHNYISIFVDLDERQVMFGTSGKDSATVEAFVKDLIAHGGSPEQVEAVACDMSPAFIKGVNERLPAAEITYDRFHLTKVVNDAVDQVRGEESREVAGLKKTRYIWLKNPENLTTQQQATLETLTRHNLRTSRAYQIKLTFQEYFEQPNREAGEAFLKRWYFWATHSRLEPIIQAAKTIKNHWDGVLNWFDGHLTRGALEGINSLLQAAKARARGYRSDRNFITMAYPLGGKLEFGLST